MGLEEVEVGSWRRFLLEIKPSRVRTIWSEFAREGASWQRSPGSFGGCSKKIDQLYGYIAKASNGQTFGMADYQH